MRANSFPSSDFERCCDGMDGSEDALASSEWVFAGKAANGEEAAMWPKVRPVRTGRRRENQKIDAQGRMSELSTFVLQ